MKSVRNVKSGKFHTYHGSTISVETEAHVPGHQASLLWARGSNFSELLNF